MMSATILIVDDEPMLVNYLAKILRREGYEVLLAGSAAAARRQMQSAIPDLILMDLKLPDADGGELLEEFRLAYPQCPSVVITAHGSIRSAVESTRRGAMDYLTKPFEPEQLLLAVRHVLREQRLGDELQRLRSRDAPSQTKDEDDSVSRSPAMRQTLTLARQAAQQDGIVLLLGESGSGKDWLAHWIHLRSKRARGPYFDVNCAAVSRELAESELFGHEAGAFTGTRARKRGLLELAEGGTLLLNEIGELDAVMQSKLLTFLDTRRFLRVGGERQVTVNARLIAATNRNLRAEVEAGRFRSDLYYRLDVFPIALPPLRDRLEDLPVLVSELLERMARNAGFVTPVIEDEVAELFSSYHWPGNIRELRNVLERAMMVSGGARILRRSEFALNPAHRSERAKDDVLYSVRFQPGRNMHELTRDLARALVQEALRRAKTKQEAAEMLGISRHALAHQVSILGLE
ncbi:MAG: sigma-54 dependent transcriptional regulator [Myxococcota bacterium]|jgi:DNA-binding NtrC family response regulator|nr:sigma-54 dependent transcriptional regulator [Myxococcota bacterium]